ncbi:hypothetical protein L873DRAFT_1822367 [Choiromyces venosus 120613-1]|uniref:Uncharacterized protein n=1 Tax=Choiromyces venosus 120613-1 TaxID=1336337 RepID=A0A3N4IU53_9PEZI|nr:hypothetical protein L873DRAFT_1822367 [Choiromyces venosus 120613-1]
MVYLVFSRGTLPFHHIFVGPRSSRHSHTSGVYITVATPPPSHRSGGSRRRWYAKPESA